MVLIETIRNFFQSLWVTPSSQPTTNASKSAQTGTNAQSKPQQSKPQQSKPQQSKPQQSKPQQSKPQQSKPQQSKSQQSKPQQSKPQQSKPQQSKKQTAQNGNQQAQRVLLQDETMELPQGVRQQSRGQQSSIPQATPTMANSPQSWRDVHSFPLVREPKRTNNNGSSAKMFNQAR